MSEFKRAIAWSVSSMVNARPGACGFFACACAISYDGGETWTPAQVQVSEAPDGDSWTSDIVALCMTLEAVDPNTALTVYVRNQAIATSFLAGWSKRGVPMKGAEIARRIFDLEESKRFTSLAVEHMPADTLSDALLKQAKAVAKARDLKLTAAERRAVPALGGAQPQNQFGGFPPVEEADA